MLPSSPNSPGVSPNPTLGSSPPYESSDPLSATLRTSGNAPTLRSTGPLSRLRNQDQYHNLILASKKHFFFYINLVSSSSHSPKRVWQTVGLNKFLHRKSSSPLHSSTLADSFSSFFIDKISNLRLSLSSNPTTSSPHSPFFYNIS